MVAELQPLRQFADRDSIPPRKTLDRQQGLVLLRGKAGGLRGSLTEMDKLPQEVSKLRESFILRLAKLSGLRHWRFI